MPGYHIFGCLGILYDFISLVYMALYHILHGFVSHFCMASYDIFRCLGITFLDALVFCMTSYHWFIWLYITFCMVLYHIFVWLHMTFSDAWVSHFWMPWYFV